jgi:hypothetical protein
MIQSSQPKTGRTRAAMILVVSLIAAPTVFAQPASDPGAARSAEYARKLQQVLDDPGAYASAVVQRWEGAARASGRWDERYAADLQGALMKLLPENLLVVGEAPSYEAMRFALATGRSVQPLSSEVAAAPETLGALDNDLVFTPVAPCRLVDTRVAGGVITAETSRNFDVDGSTFVAQGGNAGSCGVPFGVARAAAVTVTVAQPSAAGHLRAWAAFTPMPFASALNFAGGQVIANTTIVPVNPGVGSDISIFASGANVQVIVDVVGYLAAPVATALDCVTLSSPNTAVPVNSWTAIDANCPDGRTATGGGYNTPEGTLGYPGVWLTTIPNGNGWRTWVDNQTNGNRSIQTFVRCCRIPGR